MPKTRIQSQIPDFQYQGGATGVGSGVGGKEAVPRPPLRREEAYRYASSPHWHHRVSEPQVRTLGSGKTQKGWRPK